MPRSNILKLYVWLRQENNGNFRLLAAMTNNSGPTNCTLPNRNGPEYSNESMIIVMHAPVYVYCKYKMKSINIK